MHVFGHPVDMDSLLAVAHEFGLPVIEDEADLAGLPESSIQGAVEAAREADMDGFHHTWQACR